MKNIIPSIFVLLTVATAGFTQEIKDMDSRVTSATVFTNRAMVVREAAVNLSAGLQQLSFSGLTPDFLDESVRVSGAGSTDVKIVDVKVETEYTAHFRQLETKLLQQELDSLEFEMQALTDQLAVLTTKKEFIGSLKAESPKEINREILTGKPSVQDWQSMLIFFDNNLGDIYKAIRGIGPKQIKLGNEIRAVKEKLADKRQSSGRRYKNIIVSVEAQYAGRLNLQASYIVQNASWYPIYDARVDSDLKKMQLIYYGMVRQNTGEDWNNVNVILSTASPMTSRSVPELEPRFVDIFRPEAQRAVPRTEINLDELGPPAPGEERLQVSVMKSSSVAADQAASYATALVRTSQLAAVFDIPTHNDIPGDNDAHKVTIAIQPFDTQFEYTTIPKALDKVFLTGKTVNTAEFPLLPGEVNVFVDNDFFNKSTLNTIVPTDTFRLALGVDDAINVERKLVNKFTESTGLLGGKAKVTYEYEIIITNNKKSQEVVTVLDQLPISRNEKIKVQLLAPEEKAVKPDLYNRLKWTLRLQPGAKVTLPLKYQVEYPSGEKITGME
ncbi:mucoidy inhibitor MuiA family protein [candidate division KSB1 bacterium]|nr:mucoidy inhibitor MuiA family protein [candidate division KSB1 bacterium]